MPTVRTIYVDGVRPVVDHQQHVPWVLRGVSRGRTLLVPALDGRATRVEGEPCGMLEPEAGAGRLRIDLLAFERGQMEGLRARRRGETHVSSFSLKVRIRWTIQAARRICHGVMPCAPVSSSASAGIRSSCCNVSHQLELTTSGERPSRYAFCSQMLSSSQLCRDFLSRSKWTFSNVNEESDTRQQE